MPAEAGIAIASMPSHPSLSHPSPAVEDEVGGDNVVGRPTVCKIAVKDLLPGDSPRQDGINDAHVTLLAECGVPLPPILVHRQTMRIIDGMHRMSAAMRNGHEMVEVTYFDGDDHEAFILAVELNVKHGLPLSLPERKAAAHRILASNTNLSDRAIALKTGLSDKTIAKLRACSGADVPHADTRRGRDGHLYPVDGTERRQLVVQLIAEQPEAPLREIASAAGVSPTTVSNIRRRLSTGGDRVSAGAITGSEERYHAGNKRGTTRPKPAAQATRRTRSPGKPMDIGIKAALERLCADPSVRAKESGRALLRWLSCHALQVDDLPEVAGIPSHRRELVAMVARQSAHAWLEFARRLEAAEIQSGAS